MVDIIVAGVDPTELTDDVALFAGVYVVRTEQTQSIAEPADGLLVLRGAEDGVANSFDTGWTGAMRMTSPARFNGSTPVLIA